MEWTYENKNGYHSHMRHSQKRAREGMMLPASLIIFQQLHHEAPCRCNLPPRGIRHRLRACEGGPI